MGKQIKVQGRRKGANSGKKMLVLQSAHKLDGSHAGNTIAAFGTLEI